MCRHGVTPQTIDGFSKFTVWISFAASTRVRNGFNINNVSHFESLCNVIVPQVEWLETKLPNYTRRLSSLFPMICCTWKRRVFKKTYLRICRASLPPNRNSKQIISFFTPCHSNKNSSSPFNCDLVCILSNVLVVLGHVPCAKYVTLDKEAYFRYMPPILASPILSCWPYLPINHWHTVSMLSNVDDMCIITAVDDRSSSKMNRIRQLTRRYALNSFIALALS